MVHRADVLKDRTWALNGCTFRWLDKARYGTGGFRHVWESIRPHFEEVQATLQRVTILAGSSQSLISDSGDSRFYRQRQRKEAVSAEIKASLDLYFGGQGKEEKQLRRLGAHFAVKSKEAADQLPLKQLERGLCLLHNLRAEFKLNLAEVAYAGEPPYHPPARDARPSEINDLGCRDSRPAREATSFLETLVPSFHY